MKSENGNTRILLTIQGVSPSTTLWHSVDATILSRHSRAFQHTAGPDRIACREQVELVGATIRDCRQSLSAYSGAVGGETRF
jgi:hypothetical protein